MSQLSSMPSPGSVNLPTGSGLTPATAPLGDVSTGNTTSGPKWGHGPGDMVPCGTSNGSGVHKEVDEKEKMSPTEPFALAESLPMIPSNIVEKILKGQYVDLCHLLQDNILLTKKITSGGTSGSNPGPGHTQQYRKREFTKDEAGLLSWTQCFAVYTAIVCCSQDASRINDLLAYILMRRDDSNFKVG